MKIQSTQNIPNFQSNYKLKEVNAQQLQKYLKRATLALGADVLVLNGSSMQGEVAPPNGYEKVSLPWYKKIFNKIIGQPSYKYEKIETVMSFNNPPVNNHPQICYDVDIVTNLLKQLETTGKIVLEKNSKEALNFALFQDDLIKLNMINQPILGADELFDFEGINSVVELLTPDDIGEYREYVLKRLNDIIEYLSEFYAS